MIQYHFNDCNIKLYTFSLDYCHIKMNVPLLLGYVALAMVVLGPSTPVNGFEHQIYVNCSSSESIGDDTCRQSNDDLHCTTLDQALKEIQHNSTVVYIESGICNLKKEVHFQYKTDIAIIGNNNTSTVVIECSDYAGLSFSYSSNIVLESLKLRQCGSFQNSTSRNIRNDKVFEYFNFTSAIYMLFCSNATLIDVHLHHSNGIGLVLYNTVGNVIIKSCVFFNQSDAFPHQKTVVGGGGLQIEFSYCIPGNLNCLRSDHSQVDSQYSSGALYVITDSIFKMNQAHRGSKPVFKLSNEKSSYFAFGKGGGLSIILKGNAHDNSFLINNCTFYKNYAHYGGGFYVAFHDLSYANHVSITNCNITANENFDIHYNIWDFDSRGGGGMIFFLSGTNDTNVIQLHDSTFDDNVGLSGGGLAVEAIANYEKLNGSLSLDNLVFQNNSAFVGSAIHFFQDNSNCQFKLVVNISNSSFINNSPICSKKKGRSFASLVCSGIVYSNAQDLQVTGELFFVNNTSSGLEIRYSIINVLDGAKLVFQNNTSVYGGGLALYECSYIEVHPKTQFIFDNNSATEYGGAIYSGPCAQSAQSSILSMKCFISYFNRSTIPDDWDSEFNFTNNIVRTDSSHNAVYASSITSCLWPDNYDTFKVDYSRTFCWNNFHYDPDNCSDSIDSGPAFLSYSKQSFVIFPGQAIINSPLVYNGFKRKIKDPPIQACIEFGPASLDNPQMKKCKKFPPTGVLYVYQDGRSDWVTSDTIYLTTTTLTPESLQTTFEITFKNCSWPLQFDTRQCSFLLPYICCSKGCGKQCSIGSVISPDERYCIYYNNDLDLIVGHCPFAYSSKPNFVFSYSNKSFSELQVCANNRTGPLCGQCEKGLGIPINSVYFECKDCHRNIILKSWFIFILLELLPLTVMVVIILIINIRLTDGFFAGLVLYAQIISVDFQGWYYPAWLTVQQDTPFEDDYLTYISTSPYSILNLNFLRMLGPSWSNPVCLTSNMGALAVFTTWYCIAFYPSFILLLLFILQTLYDNGSSCVFFVFKRIRKILARFHQFLNIQPSLMDFAASIYVLSFTQLVSISYKMLHYSTWRSMTNENLKGIVFFYDASLNYFGWPHAFFGIFAFTVLFSIILLPTLFLSFYQFKWFHQFLTFSKLRYQFLVCFADVFSGSLKNGTTNSKLDFRSFAGLYLVFRVIAMTFYYVTSHPKIVLYCETCLSLFFAGFIMIFRPYKKKIVNFAEFTVFSVLGLMSALCLSQGQEGRHICVVAIMHIPIVLLLVYIVYRIVTKVYQYYKNRHPLQEGNDNYSNEGFQESMAMHTFPDRVLNPTKYQERHVGFISSESAPFSVNNSQIHLRNPASSHSGDDIQNNDTRFETSSRTTVQIGNTAKTNTTSRTTFQTSIRSSVKNTTSDYGSTRTDDTQVSL